MLQDVEAGADVFCFAQDQFARLVEGGALSQLGVAAQKEVIESNDAGVVAAGMSGDTLYAYPMTSDNGYFMFYDKSVVKEADIDSLEAIIKDCEDAGKNFSFELTTSAWYIASFFFAVKDGGTAHLCKSDWTTDSDGKFISVDDTFNSANGLVAAKGMAKLVNSKCFNSSSSTEDFAAAIPSAVVVSGTWAYETAKAALGDNLGIADLPSFVVDGNSYHLGSYSGCKLMGVKPQTDAKKGAILHKLARYLTNYDCQMERFNNFSWGPSNSKAQAEDAVKANPALSALLQQSPYAVPQCQIHGSWWDIGKALGVAIQEANGSEQGLKDALASYEATISELFSLSGYILVGQWNGWSNSDTTMKLLDQGDGVYGIMADVSAGDNGRIVVAGEWGTEYSYSQLVEGQEYVTDDNGGDHNFKFNEGGKYLFVIDTNKGTVSIQKAMYVFVGQWNGWNNSDLSTAFIYKDGQYQVTVDVPEADYKGGRPVNPTAWDGFDMTAHKIVEGGSLAHIEDSGDHNMIFEAAGKYTVAFDSNFDFIVKAA